MKALLNEETMKTLLKWLALVFILWLLGYWFLTALTEGRLSGGGFDGRPTDSGLGQPDKSTGFFK